MEPIPELQFGIQKYHSTQRALLKFHNDITCNLRDKICTVGISLDIAKAFDSVYYNAIIYKLIIFGVDPFLVKIIHSYLNKRKFIVQINNITSNLGPVNSVVPEGDVLATFLFNLFLHAFPHYTRGSKAILYAYFYT